MNVAIKTHIWAGCRHRRRNRRLRNLRVERGSEISQAMEAGAGVRRRCQGRNSGRRVGYRALERKGDVKSPRGDSEVKLFRADGNW